MNLIKRLFGKETSIEREDRLLLKIALLKKQLEVEWKFEKTGGYLFGNRGEIISIENRLVKTKHYLDLLQRGS